MHRVWKEIHFVHFEKTSMRSQVRVKGENEEKKRQVNKIRSHERCDCGIYMEERIHFTFFRHTVYFITLWDNY